MGSVACVCWRSFRLVSYSDHILVFCNFMRNRFTLKACIERYKNTWKQEDLKQWQSLYCNQRYWTFFSHTMTNCCPKGKKKAPQSQERAHLVVYFLQSQTYHPCLSSCFSSRQQCSPGAICATCCCHHTNCGTSQSPVLSNLHPACGPRVRGWDHCPLQRIGAKKLEASEQHNVDIMSTDRAESEISLVPVHQVTWAKSVWPVGQHIY
jgi:hypothetical protein